MEAPKVLVVDDEESVGYVLRTFLEGMQCDVRVAGSAEEAIELLCTFSPQVAVLDIVLPGKSGIELLAEMKQRCNKAEIVVISVHGSVTTAVEAIGYKTYDYLRKPFENLEEIWITVQRALQRYNEAEQNRVLLKVPAQRGS